MNELSLIELETFRSLALQNSIELLAEAELLFQHKKFARTYTLAHLSSEELAKLPILAAHGVNLVNGQTISWKRLDEKLRSHETKLKGLLFVDLLAECVNDFATPCVINLLCKFVLIQSASFAVAVG